MRVDIWLRAREKKSELTAWTIWRWGGVRGGKGPSAQQQQLQQQQAQFYSTLTQSYQQQFANQNAILQTLQTSYAPILQGGPNQYGFSAAEDSALRTQATETTTAGFANALTAQEESTAARGGGNESLPSGAETAIEANIRGQAAATEAGQQLGITQAGYQQGRQNYWQAANALGGVAGLENPTGYISGANTAGENAFKSADIINSETISPWGAIGGALGGVAGFALGGPAGASIGESLGGTIGSAAGGGPNPFGGVDTSQLEGNPAGTWGGILGF